MMTKEQPTGLQCPSCKAPFSKVYWTAPRNGFRSRGRECLICRHRFATKEVLVGGDTATDKDKQ